MITACGLLLTITLPSSTIVHFMYILTVFGYKKNIPNVAFKKLQKYTFLRLKMFILLGGHCLLP